MCGGGGVQRLLARAGVGSWTLRSGRAAWQGGGGGVTAREESGFGEMGSRGLGVTPAHSCPSSAQKSLVEMSPRVWLRGAKGLHPFPVPSQCLAAR